MALNNYILNTRSLLQNPAATSGLVYDDTTLTRYINIARGQVAVREKCIRALGTVSFAIGQQASVFGNINFGSSLITGITGALNIRRLSLQLGTGHKKLTPRSWEWFDSFYYNKVVPETGQPRIWAQHAQGAGGSFYVYPIPDTTITTQADAECYPISLVDDTSVEALPYAWIDCVPFFAAYYALLSSQTGARDREAERMMDRYEEFAKAARGGATPGVLPHQYAGAPDPVEIVKMSQAMRGGPAQPPGAGAQG